MSSFLKHRGAMVTLQQQSAIDCTRATIFDIRLLTDLIGRHLTTIDIYRCTLVNRQFYSMFQPFLYSCIFIRSEETFAKFTCRETRAAFSRYFRQLRKFSTRFGDCVVDLVKDDGFQDAPPPLLHSTPVVFTNLTFFQYRTPSMEASKLDLYSDSVLLLLEASPSLQVLILSHFAVHSETLILRLAKIIREKGRQLKDLRLLDTARIQGIYLFTLLWSCAAVEVLILCYGILPDSPKTPADTLSRLKALAREALSSKGAGSHRANSAAAALAEFPQDTDRMEFAWKTLAGGIWMNNPELEMILELLQMCPFMEGMVIPKLNEQDAITYLAPVVAKVMPQLRYLNLNLISDHPLANCRLVRSCKNLVSLNINRLKFDSRSLVDAVVSEHGHSLQALYIGRSNKLTSQQLNFILSNCPRLLSLYALVLESGTRYSSPILNSEDMAMVPVKPGWSCKDLETLHLCYSTEDTNIGIPEVLWRQIGQLSKLKDLILLRHLREGTGVQEQESVMQAMYSWKALTELRWLELWSLDAFLDKMLVDQVKDQWAKLEWVRYSYTQSEERDGVS